MSKPERDQWGHLKSGYAVYDYDKAILRELPFEDEKLGGILPLAVQVGTLRRGALGEAFSSAQIMGRLKVLTYVGYAKAVRVPPVNKGMAYQLTHTGRAFLNGKEPHDHS